MWVFAHHAWSPALEADCLVLIASVWLLRSYDSETRYNSRDSFYFFYFFYFFWNKLYSLLGTSRHIHSVGKGKIASE